MLDMRKEKIIVNVTGIIVFIISLFIYVLTLCPTVFWYDSTEFIVQSYHLGTAHPTGYPLWGLLGKLATLLPLGTAPHDIAYRLNFLTALFTAISVMFTYFISMKFLVIDRRTKLSEILDEWWQKLDIPLYIKISTAVIAAFSLSFTPAVWNNSTCAEVYSLNLSFVTGLILLLLHWSDKIIKSQIDNKNNISFVKIKNDALIMLLVYIYGISFGNHMSIALLFPGFFIFILLMDVKILLRWKMVLLTILLWLFAFSSMYFYLPIRSVDSSIKWFDIVSWDHLWYMLAAKSYSAADFSVSKALSGLWEHTGRHIGRNILIFGKIPIYGKFQLNLSVALAFFGTMFTLLANWRRFILLLLVFFSYILYMASYQSQNQDFLLPVYMICALMIGSGSYFFMVSIYRFVIKRWEYKFKYILYLIPLIFLIVPIYMLAVNYDEHDLSDDYTAWDYGEKMIKYVDDKNIAFFQGDAMAPLLYQTRILHPELSDNFIQMFIYHLNTKGLYELDKDGNIEYEEIKQNEPKKKFLFFEDTNQVEEVITKKPKSVKGNQNDTPYEELMEPILKSKDKDKSEILICYKDPAPLVNKRLGDLERFLYNKGYSLKPIMEDGKEIYLANLIPRATLNSEPFDKLYAKSIDISEFCNADYHHDPFETSVKGKNHYPALNPEGETIYWKDSIPFKILPSYLKDKKASVISMCRNPKMKPIILELDKKPSKAVYLAVCGGSVTSKYEEIAKININFSNGSKQENSIWTNREVFEYWSQNHKIFIPPDLEIWTSSNNIFDANTSIKDLYRNNVQFVSNLVDDTKNQNITLIEIPIKSNETPETLVINRINEDDTGMTIFAITQVYKNPVEEKYLEVKNLYENIFKSKMQETDNFYLENKIDVLENTIELLENKMKINNIVQQPKSDYTQLNIPVEPPSNDQINIINNIEKSYDKLNWLSKRLETLKNR